jgi:VIT1/CCC1 family predicted Fe2+/Mn2+ transporter
MTEVRLTESPPHQPSAKRGIVAGLLNLRRGPWENLATFLIAIGVIMLMQPFFLMLYTYSFITTLVGTVLFVIVSKFPD